MVLASGIPKDTPTEPQGAQRPPGRTTGCPQGLPKVLFLGYVLEKVASRVSAVQVFQNNAVRVFKNPPRDPE